MALESWGKHIDIKHLVLDNLNRKGVPPATPSNPVRLFEDLARKTWERIRLSVPYRVSQGEETITDINLLEIAMSGIKEVRLWKCPKEQEAKAGIDWEWLIGSDKVGWLRYAVQAKKIKHPVRAGKTDLKTGRYQSLGHKVGSQRQVDILEKYAYAKGRKALDLWDGDVKNVSLVDLGFRAIPLYCFYNYVNKQKTGYDPYWHCALPVEAEQLGCSITPLEVAKKAIDSWGQRSFEHIHSDPRTHPWRCLVRCQHLLKFYNRPEKNFIDDTLGPVHVYERLPLEVVRLFGGDDSLTLGYGADLNYIPKRVMVVEIGGVIGDSKPQEKGSDLEADSMPIRRKF